MYAPAVLSTETGVNIGQVGSSAISVRFLASIVSLYKSYRGTLVDIRVVCVE